jgi:hypothetical protein
VSSVAFSISAHVKAGTEQYRCQAVTMPDDGGFVVSGSHTYTPGSHHVLLYRTDLTTVPDGMGGNFDCSDETGLMGHVRGVVYGAQTPTGGWQLPDGVGLPYRPGEILLLQAHYLDASASDLDARVDVTLATRADGIEQRAGFFFFYDPFIHVPAGARARASMRCLVRQDVTLLGESAHFHRRGVGYQAFLDPPGGTPAAQPFYTTSDWSNPLQQRATTAVASGSRLRFACDYDNSSGTTEYYAGPSATQNEMCMFIGLYYPDLGAEDDFCFSSADGFGNGTATCAQATSCLQACPTHDFSHLPDVDPCLQKCIADSCQSASGPLFEQLYCLQGQCNTECVLGDGDCTSCAIAKCAAQVEACQSHTCAQ